MDGISEMGIRALLAAIVKRAVLDVRAQRPCSCGRSRRDSGTFGLISCGWDAHTCAEDAGRFLASDACAAICDYLGVAHSPMMPEVARAAPAVFVSIGCAINPAAARG